MEVARLNMLKASHLNQVYALEELVYRKYRRKSPGSRNGSRAMSRMWRWRQPQGQEGFCGMEVDGRHYTEKRGRRQGYH